MAKVSEQLLGVVNGKIGNLVYRKVGDKTFVSVRPSKYNVTGTVESTKVKNGFKNLVVFSSFINSIPLLHAVWSNKHVKGNRTYNKIFSHNKRFIKADKINQDYLILPAQDLAKHYIFDLKIEVDTILLHFIDDFEYDLNLELNYNAIFILYSEKKKQFTYQVNTLEPPELNTRTLVTLPIDKTNLLFLQNSPKCIIYGGIIVANNEGKILSWSNTKGIVK